jgi:hypothetical protein
MRKNQKLEEKNANNPSAKGLSSKASKPLGLIEFFHQKLPEVVGSSIHGCFYKRKATRLEELETQLRDKMKMEEKKEGGIRGFFKKLSRSESVRAVRAKLVSNYNKRFFFIDTRNACFNYGDTLHQAQHNPKFSVLFRDLIGSRKDVVTMPIVKKVDGRETIVREQLMVVDEDLEIDRGPDKETKFVIEV